MALSLKEKAREYESIVVFYDKSSRLHAVIAIHDTTLGPSIGGCRMIPYKSEEDALDDVLRLAKSMTYKCALAGVKYGGGKSVILSPKKNYDRQSIFRAFGSFVNKLEGKYITAIDSGTSMEDMEVVSRETHYVTGYNTQSDCDLNPSYFTALGVMESLFASVEFKYGSRDLKEKVVCIKGVGGVGGHLARLINEYGAQLYVTDINSDKVKNCVEKTGAKPIDPGKIFNLKYDILCPCDVEHTVTSNNIDQIKTDIIVGATNNQLEESVLATALSKKGILYCPDFVANSGGLIYVTDLYEKNSIKNIEEKIKNIRFMTKDVFSLSKSENISTEEAADILAQNIIDKKKQEANKLFS